MFIYFSNYSQNNDMCLSREILYIYFSHLTHKSILIDSTVSCRHSLINTALLDRGFSLSNWDFPATYMILMDIFSAA